MARKKHLINVHTSTGTTAPTGASLYLGEIAVQHKPNDPALWIKVGTAETSTTYEKFIGSTEITNMVSAASGLVKDLSAVTLTGVTMNSSPVSVTNHVANLGTVITAETQLSTATTGTGNVVGSIGVSNHKITSTLFSAASADQISKLSGATTAHTANTTMHITAAERTRWNNAWTSGVSAYTKVEALSAGTINLVGASAATVFSSAKTYVDNEIGKLDSTGHTTDSNHYLTSVTITNGKITSVGEVAVPAESNITTATSGDGNVITNLTATGHQITMVKGITAATSAQVTTLSSATVAHINSAASHVSTSDRTTWNGKQDAITDLATIRNNALSGASAYTNVNSLSAATTAHTANTTVHVTENDKTKWNAAITGVTSAGTGNAFTNYSVANNVLTLTKGATYLTTAATTTQGDRADSALQTICGSTYITTNAKSGGAGAKIQTVTAKQQNVETASATGQGLADAYDVKQYVDGIVTSTVNYKGATATLPTTSKVGDMYITTAQIVLTAAQSATGAAQTAETGDFIIARESGKWDVIQKNLDGAVTGNLTADTVTLGSGTHTVKSLANGSNGQVLAVVSNKPAWTSAVKVNSATTADSATNATNATNAVSATTSLSANTAAALTGNITTGQVTNLTTKIQTTKVNSATTADSASNAAKVNNHTVESDVPSSAVFTDTATTQTGHYTPSASASTEGSTTGFIRQIKLDSKKHVVGMVSGTTSFTETAVTTKAGTTGSTAAPVLSSIVTGGTKGHELTLNYTNKVNSATTADSATNATNATNAVSATTSQSANTAAALTGNITTGQVTNLTTKIQTTKVNSAITADSATNATNAVSATTSLSANVATNATKVNNHTVNSDVPSNAVFTDTKVTAVGNHYTATTATKTGGTTTTTADWAVKGITYDAAGHIVSVISGSVLTSASDTATTETGHYSPTTSASTKGTTEATANYVKGIRIDSKNHVIDVVTGTVVTAQTQLSTATTGTGNVVCGLTVSNHKITTLMFSAAPASLLVALSAETTAHTANTTMHITDVERTRWNNAWTSGVSAYTKVEDLSAGTLYELKQTNHNIPYVVQSGNIYTGTTYAYVAEAPEITELVDGQSIIFHPKQCSYSGTTNGSANTCSLSLQLADGTTTTPRPIYLKATTKLTSHLSGCTDVKLTYHDNATYSATTGLCGWWLDFYYDTNSNTLPTQLYGLGPIRAHNAIPRYTLAMQNSAGTWDSITTNAVTGQTSSARTDVGFVLWNDIVYYNATGLTAGKNSATGNTYIAINSFDFRYVSNCTTSAGTAPLESGYSVYLVGTVGNDGLFYLDETTWWTQTLPTTEDGKVYMYVGQVVSRNAATVALYPVHPVYEYKNGHVRIYQEDPDIQMILGSGYTYSGIPYVTSATSISDAYSALTNEVIKDEKTVSAAFNDLNDRVRSLEQNSGSSADLEALSAAVVYNYNYIDEVDYVAAQALNDLNDRIGGVLEIDVNGTPFGQYCPSADTTIDLTIATTGAEVLLTGYQLASGSTEQELMVVSSDTVNEAIGKLQKQNYMSNDDVEILSGAVVSKEYVIANSLNDLNDRIIEISATTQNCQEKTRVENSQPANGMLPNVFYNLGQLTGNVTLEFDDDNIDNSILNHYYFTFSVGSTIPTITYPYQINSWFGGSEPVLVANSYYEVSVINGVAAYIQV